MYLIPKIYRQTDSSNWSHSDPGIACSKVVDIWFRQVSTVLYLISEMSGKDDFLKTDLFKDIRKLINIIDEVRDYGLDKEISLPRIAVLGTQSSGKSSLLQNIVGLDFLPRGSGVVTRRPLELRLVHTDKRKGDGKPYAIFENDTTGKVYTNFGDVRMNIEKLTDDVAGKQGNIVNDPIKLRIYSNDCPDLTIIDLPGITRIDIRGQKDIEKVTTEMAGYYCKDPKTIILCVIPANQDLAISDGLKLARQWDKEGLRTIGVITKIDIMDKGTSAKKMLMNEQIHLKLGYIGIVNRAQEDIINKVPVQIALKRQIQFFNKHPEYREIPERYLGTRSLTSKLSELLVEAIKRSLPDIVKQIEEKLDDLRGELEAMGTPPPASGREKSNFLMGLITDFSNDYKNTLSGKYVANAKTISSEEIGRGAVIKGKFKSIFQAYPSAYKCSSDYDDDYIKNTLKSHQGDEISGFPSMECFRSLLVPQLAKLKEPTYSTLDFIYMELVQLAGELNHKVFSRFPDLLALVNDITNKKLTDLKAQTEEILDTLLQGEMNTVFTNDAKYLSARDDLLAKTAQSDENPEKLFIREIKERLDGYFRIVVTILNDSVPKIIGYFLVRQSQETLQMVLFNQLNQEAIFQTLGEPKQVEEKRKQITLRINTLNKSYKALKKDPTVSKLLDDS